LTAHPIDGAAPWQIGEATPYGPKNGRNQAIWLFGHCQAKFFDFSPSQAKKFCAIVFMSIG
jgi:hypothetical protein